MRVWRLASHRHAAALDGAGNRDSGARWNSGRGRGVVYTCLHPSTCVLETFVHFGPALRAAPPPGFALAEIAVPDDAPMLRLSRADIPADPDARDDDGRRWYQRIGDAWLEAGEALALVAPSAVVPQDLNVMLNPAHPRMADVRVVGVEPFSFDPRLATP